MMYRLSIAVAVFASAALAGCSDLTQSGCTLELRPALFIRIADSATKAYAALGAHVTAQHGGVIDSAVVRSSPLSDSTAFQLGDSTAIGLGDTPGRYTLAITKAGYRDWKRTNIVVGAGNCGQPDTQIFTAFLQRL